MKNEQITTPRFAKWLMKRMAAYQSSFLFINDMEEEFYALAESDGVPAARRWFTMQAVRSLPMYFRLIITWNFVMLKNYFIIAFRNAFRQKAYSFINIAGLSIGMATCMTLLVFIHAELSYENFHEKRDRLYRLGVHTVMNGADFRWYSSNAITGGILEREFPEVEETTRMMPMGSPVVTFSDRQFNQDYAYWVDEGIFDMFTYPFKEGDPATALISPYTVVLTETVARQYFGEERAVGKALVFNNEHTYTVTGVVYDPPDNTDFPFNVLASFKSAYAIMGEDNPILVQFQAFNLSTFVLLKEGVDHHSVTAKFPELVDRLVGDQLAERGATMELLMQPLTDVHLRSSSDGGPGPILYVYIFSAIALFILVLASINFINLSTARSAKRMREVGLRKVFGAVRSRLVRQFLVETFLFSFIALLLSLIMLEFSLPYMSEMTGMNLYMSYTSFTWLVPAFLLMTAAVSFGAGAYPALYLSRSKPVDILKSSKGTCQIRSRFRSVLLVVQFVISLSLMIGTGLIFNQLNFMRAKNPGFNKENVVVIYIGTSPVRNSIPTFREMLHNEAGIISVSAASSRPALYPQYNTCLPEGFSKENTQLMDDIQADHFYVPALGLEIIDGRNFSPEFPSDRIESVLINETAAKKFGFEEPVGKKVYLFKPGFPDMHPSTVVGVIKDYHARPLDTVIEPMVISNNPLEHPFNPARYILVRIQPGNVTATIESIEDVWNQLDADKPLEYYFLDEGFNRQFGRIERTMEIFTDFTMFAIFIACLGLFGMASYTAEQRTKEIGIRRVLGATTGGILYLLNSDVIRLLLVSNVISWPVTYLLMQQWFIRFPYRPEISPLAFVLSALAVLAISIGVVSYQSVRAARANPVDSLRYE